MSWRDTFKELMEDYQKKCVHYHVRKLHNGKLVCKLCDKRITESDCKHNVVEEFDDEIICTSCGEVLEKLLTHRLNSYDASCITMRPKYDRTANFQKVIDEFQARYYTKIPDKVYSGLETILSKDDVIYKSDIRAALKKLRFSKYYKDVHLIHHNFTGAPKNNIIEYNVRLIKDFNYMSRQYSKRNFFNKQLVLYILLLHYGCEFNKSEFFIPKTAKEEDLIKLIPSC